MRSCYKLRQFIIQQKIKQMKNHYFIFVILFFFFALQISSAQITLTTNNNWAIGEDFTYNFVSLDTIDFDPGADGINQTWNFDTLDFFTSTTSNTVEVSSLSNGSLYPNANIGLQSLDSGSEGFYLATSDAQSFYGAVGLNSGGITSSVVYDDPQDFIRYPMTIDDSFTDDFGGTVTTTAPFDRSGSTTVIADGYGTLITPIGTYNNVLRLFTQMEYNDSFNGGNPFVFYTENRYSWYDANSGFPLVLYTEIYTNGALTISSLGYLDVLPSSTNAALDSEIQLSVFPNPTAEQIFVDYTLTENTEVSVSILNLVGKQVVSLSNETQGAGDHRLNADLSHLPNGSYFVKLKIGEEIGMHKILVLK